MKFSKETKKQVKKRDKTCLICNTRENLTVAHIFIPNRKKGKDTVLNACVLCRECHNVLDFPNLQELDYSMWLEYVTQMYLINYYGFNYRKMMDICNTKQKVLKR